MRRLILSVVPAAVLLGTPVLAADLVPYTPPPSVAPAVGYDWSGAYLGVNGGFGWGTVDYSNIAGPPAPVPPDGSFNIDGWLGGVTAGFNFQLDNNFVVGLEGDIDAAKIDGDGAPFDPASATPTVPSTSIDWLGTVRGRAGIAFGSVLLYGTGGVAFGGVTNSISNVTGSGDNRTAKSTQVGWTVGAGVEAALTDNISAKVEYLHVDLGTRNSTYTGPAFAVTADGHPTAEIVRAGLNFRF